jgi:hypothetical protein
LIKADALHAVITSALMQRNVLIAVLLIIEEEGG